MMEERKDYERCLRCGRKLKNRDARRIGYGKKCYERYLASYRNTTGFIVKGNMHGESQQP